MSRSVKTFLIGLGAGLLGILLSIPSFSIDLQERFGLKLLFSLRGTRQPPSDVIIVAMDRESIEELNLSKKIQKWPRTLHAQLVQILTRNGAKVIVFDLLFDEAHDLVIDETLAAVVNASEKVVVGASIRQEKIPIRNSGGTHLVDLNVETLVPPIPSLLRSAIAVAPFPLPKVPIQLSQYWLFKAGAGNSPTLPVVAFFIYTSHLYESFSQLYNRFRPQHHPAIHTRWEEVVSHRRVEETLVAIRETFDHDPAIAIDMLHQLESQDDTSRHSAGPESLSGLIRMFQSKNSRYLNLYGPAGTFHTRSYYQVLRALDARDGATDESTALRTDFSEKVVFVGVSENRRPQYQDGYHTVFSRNNGIDISGVEIAATAFANLLEDRPLKPLKWPLHVLAVFIFGMMLGLICTVLPTGISTLCVIAIGCIHLVIAMAYFNAQAIWIPIVVPLFMLMPLAVFGTVVCRYSVEKKERKAMRKAFGYYLPDTVIDQLAESMVNLNANNQLVYGICLYTDAQKYATLSELMDPKELARFMNRYYEKLFMPVKKNGGIVSDVVGDSMMAIWAKSTPDDTLRAAACDAALEIADAIRKFNRQQQTITLHTRIGMHAGHIVVGNIGAVDHYEYRPVGDIVNTASRMEGMNKHLGTQILVSDQVIHRLEGLMTRELGTFLPFGKSNPVVIHELLGYAEAITPKQRQLCSRFQEGLRAYRQRRWDAAIIAFEQTLGIYRADGPSIFYKKLCEGLKQQSPDENWDGMVVMGQK